MNWISTPELARRSGASYRQVDYWSRTGILVPEGAEARGSGTQRAYAETDVAIARILCDLSRMGVQGDPLRNTVAALRQVRSWAGWLVVGENVSEVVTLPMPEGACVVVHLADYADLLPAPLDLLATT